LGVAPNSSLGQIGIRMGGILNPIILGTFLFIVLHYFLKNYYLKNLIFLLLTLMIVFNLDAIPKIQKKYENGFQSIKNDLKIFFEKKHDEEKILPYQNDNEVDPTREIRYNLYLLERFL
jgi:hypothetical protein